MVVCWNIGKFVNSWLVFNLQEEAMKLLTKDEIQVHHIDEMSKRKQRKIREWLYKVANGTFIYLTERKGKKVKP
jgi:hypothetical protein